MRRAGSGRSACYVAVGLVLASVTVWSDVPRMFGMPLNERDRVEVQQTAGTLAIALVSRNRVPPNKSFSVDGEKIQRITERIELMKVRSEVIVAAAPNFRCNPGDRYRITVDGVCFTPHYHSVREVGSEEALAYLYGEFSKLQGRLDGVQRAAVQQSAGISLAALNRAGFLPPDVSKTVLESKAGKARFGEDTTQKSRTTVAAKGRQMPVGPGGSQGAAGHDGAIDEKGTDRK